MDEIGLIHMNGRVYDPKLGRFLQADPFIQAASNTQSYNRYSYVWNNPLNTTDPSGYFAHLAVPFLIAAGGSYIAANAAEMSGNQWIGTVVSVGFCATGNVAACTGASFGANYSQTGNGFQAAYAAAVTGVSASAFGSLAGIKSDVGRIIAHGTLGGAVGIMQGGKFGHSFASAGLTKAFTTTVDLGTAPGHDARIARTIIAATAGGTISKFSGGKFANGAMTAAMAHTFNYESGVNAQKGAPITDAELALAKEGKFLEFWRSRHLAGDPVARTALTGWGDPDFVGAGLSEKLAAAYTWRNLSSHISDNGLTVSMEQIGAELALAHANAVIGDGRGISNLLSPTQVAGYHHSVFRGHGIPAHVFGGTHKVPFVSVPVQGGWGSVMFDANTYSGLWCKGCDSTP